MTVDVYVTTGDNVRVFNNVNIRMPETKGLGSRWIDIVYPGSDDTVTLNFRAWTIREKVPEKVKTRKRDGAILDDGYRSTMSFEAVAIYRRSKKKGGEV